MNVKLIIEQEVEKILDEDYPSSFDMVYFKTLNSFNKRIKYCGEHLQRIGGGSSRIVYKIDDEKVLKLAKNRIGIDQNEIEISQGNYYDLKDVVANVFDNHDDSLWVEMEFARKLTAQKFKQLVGIDFDLYTSYLEDYYYKQNSNKRRYGFSKNFSGYAKEFFDRENQSREFKDEAEMKELFNEYIKKLEEFMWENEFTYNMLSYVGAYDVFIGDLKKINSYGIVKRNGEDTIVVIDFGLNPDLFNKNY
jgi:hypothetical protein